MARLNAIKAHSKTYDATLSGPISFLFRHTLLFSNWSKPNGILLKKLSLRSFSAIDVMNVISTNFIHHSIIRDWHTHTQKIEKKVSGCTTKVDEMNTRRTREIEKRICMADAFKSKVNEFHQFRYLVTTISIGIHWNDNIRHLHQTRWCIANGSDALFSDTKRQLLSCCCCCHFVSNTIHFTTITIDAPYSLLSEILRNIYDSRIK